MTTRLTLVCLALLLGTASTSLRSGLAAAGVSPNMWKLSGAGFSILYTVALDGRRQLTLTDRTGRRVFEGSQVHTATDMNVGASVSVTVTKTIDGGAQDLTVLLPRVVITPPASSTKITTEALAIIHRLIIGKPPKTGLVSRQLDSYSSLTLTGTASFTR
jgi:hypothetical protein